MARHGPPPGWDKCEERVLENLFCGDDDAAAGDALVELRRRYNQKLWTRSRCGCGGNTDLSAEALQRLDTRLWEKRKSYLPTKNHWINWTRIILSRIIIDLFRERARFGGRPTASLADLNSSPERTAQGPGWDPEPDWQLKLQELQQAMADCLQRLPPEERDALTRQVLDDSSLQEIANKAGVPVQTVGSRVFRAKQKMRDCLKRKGYEGGEV